FTQDPFVTLAGRIVSAAPLPAHSPERPTDCYRTAAPLAHLASEVIAEECGCPDVGAYALFVVLPIVVVDRQPETLGGVVHEHPDFDLRSDSGDLFPDRRRGHIGDKRARLHAVAAGDP